MPPASIPWPHSLLHLECYSLLNPPSPSAFFSHHSISQPFAEWLRPKIRSNVTSLEEFPLTSLEKFIFSPYALTALYSWCYYVTQHSALPIRSYQLPSFCQSLLGWNLIRCHCVFSTWHKVGPLSRFVSELNPVGIQAGMDRVRPQRILINRCTLTL